MESRGRKSAAELSLVSVGDVQVMERPAPPKELSDEQSMEWRAIVARLPADWFCRETHAMLTTYCRHVVAGRRIAELIAQHEGSDEFNVKDYDRLLKMQEREGRAISSLATRMRISQHATYDKKRKKPIETEKPWAR